MPIVDMYSSRHAPEQPGDVWEYEQIPHVLRVQVSNIVKGALGGRFIDQYNSMQIYELIRETVSHEHGKDFLANQRDAAADVHSAIRTSSVGIWLNQISPEITLFNPQGRSGSISTPWSELPHGIILAGILARQSGTASRARGRAWQRRHAHGLSRVGRRR